MGARLRPLIEAGRLAACSIVLLEVLFSARSPGDYRDTRRRISLALELVPMNQAVLDRAVDVQALLAQRSRHRGVSLPELMIAATAEQHDLIVLHYDVDFDRIAQVSGQRTEWVVGRGTVP